MKITIADIMKTVAQHYGISREHLLSECRSSQVILARHVGMYLARTGTRASLPAIGRRFHRDYKTVHHAVTKIEKVRLDDSRIQSDIDALTRKIEAAAQANSARAVSI